MTIQNFLDKSTSKLADAGIATTRLDSLILLEDATNKDRTWLLAHPTTPLILKGRTFQGLEHDLERRARHEPLAYIRGKSEFYGREFIINAHTLQPRSETEIIIDQLKQTLTTPLYKVEPCTVVDVGTGSGALGITAKLEVPKAVVIATDIDAKCLKVARKNAKNLGADVKFYQGDLISPLPSSVFHHPYSIILANLPYVPDSHTINKAAMFEPKHAIFGGPDGLDLYRQLFYQINQLKNILTLPDITKTHQAHQHQIAKKLQFDSKQPEDRQNAGEVGPRYVFTESLPPQHRILQNIARQAGYKLRITSDFIQVFELFR